MNHKRLKLLIVFFILNSSLFTIAQNFTWMRGSNTSGITGTFGSMGVPSSTTDPGGRHGCATWTDASGNLWLFGGEGYSNTFPLSWLNDLWKYNPTTNQWTWVRGSSGPNAVGVYGTQGVAANSNEPGAREFAMTWTDASGNFWLFGGDGFANNSTFGRLGDLWKYNPSTNQWTWMKGFNTIVQNGIFGTQNVANSANNPGCRYYGATWSDANNLYLFGGRGYAASGTPSYLNDFWSYNLSTNNWTWISGSQNTLMNGNYGTQGVASTTNIPGARAYSSTWTDANNNFYLFGGLGLGATGTQSYLNDLWKYNSITGTWTWLHGPNSTFGSPSYGFQGIGSASVIPGARYTSASWIDPIGNLWLFGGQGVDSTGLVAYLNDLFKYEPSSNKWTWMKGPKTGNNNGIYGSMGIASQSNMPGSRLYNTWWRDVHQTFWLMGGEGLDVSNSSVDHMNDLWGFKVPCNPDSISTLQGNQICSGNPLNLTAHNQFPSTINWFNSSNTLTPIGSGSVLAIGNLTTSSSNTVYTYYASANACSFAPMAAITVTVKPLPTVTISGASSVCLGGAITLTASGANTYTWTGGHVGSSNTYTPNSTQAFNCTAIGTASNGCAANSVYNVTVYALPTLSISATRTIICFNFNQSTTLTILGANTYSWSNQSTNSLNIVTPTNSISTILNYSVIGTNQYGCTSTASINISSQRCGGFNSLDLSSSLVVFPNPNNGIFTIKHDGNFNNINLEIFNHLGQLVLKTDINKNNVEINSQLPAGIYYYTLSANKQTLNGKLIIQ